MEQLKISLFAPLQIELNDNTLSDFRTQKVLALLSTWRRNRKPPIAGRR